MKKIIVIGCPGSGKSTFAKRLYEKINLPLFHLDAIWHKADKTHISREEFDDRLSEILSLDAYIIDGNYQRTLDRRISRCDTVILFDLPTEDCLSGAAMRVGKARADMPWCESELDPEFKRQIEEFKTVKLPEIYALIEKYKSGRNTVILKSREESESFLESISTEGE